MSVAALYNALSGLQTSQRALGVIGSNIANANTEGYTRKIPGLESLVLDGRGAGVQMASIQRNVDEYLMRDRRNEISGLKQQETLQTYYTQLQDIFGSVQKNNSIATDVTNFDTALKAFSLAPEDLFAANQVIIEGTAVAERMQDTYNRLQDLRARADQEIGERVEEINSILEQIDDLNVNIVRDVALSRDGGDLRDKRDVLLNRLSELVDISYFYRPEGDVAIHTRAGQVLLDVDAQKVTHTTANDLTSGIFWDVDKTFPPGISGAIGGIFVGDTPTSLDDAIAKDITKNLIGGEIRGLIDMRDNLIPDLQAQMDEMARVMREQLNAAHNASVGYPPPQQLTGTFSFLQNTVGSSDLPISNYTPSIPPVATPAGGAAYSGTGLLRISVVTREPTSAIGKTEFSRTVDLDALRAGTAIGNTAGLKTAGELTIEDVVNHINAMLDIDGAAGTADRYGRASINASGQVVIESDGRTRGVVLESPDFIYRSTGIGGIGAADFDGSTATIALAQNETVTITDSAGNLVGTVTIDASTAATDTLGALRDAINSQVADVTARTERQGTNGHLEIVANDGRVLSFAFSVPATGTSLGLTQSSGASATTQVSKSFPQSDMPLWHYDGVRTQDTGVPWSLSINGTTVAVPFSLSTTAPQPSLQEVADAINTAVATVGNPLNGTGIEARLVKEDGWRLEIVDNDGTQPTIAAGISTPLYDLLGIQSRNRGFSHSLGLNDFYVNPEVSNQAPYSASQNLQVRSALVTDPKAMSRGQMNYAQVAINAAGTLTTGAGNPAAAVVRLTAQVQGVQSGDNRGAAALYDAIADSTSFAAQGEIPAMDTSIRNYATRIISDNSIRASLNKEEVTFRDNIVNELETRIEGISGVNIDEELSNLVLFQNAYTAAARVITASQQMFDDLLGAVG